MSNTVCPNYVPIMSHFNSFLDPSLIVATLLDRMRLVPWTIMNEESNLPEETHPMGNEFLQLLIGLLCERHSPDVSDNGIKDELRHRLTHLLVSGK